MNKKIKTDAVDELFEAILHLKTVEECYAFFEDVCTVNELLSFPSDMKLRVCCGTVIHTWISRRRRVLRLLRSVVRTVR